MVSKNFKSKEVAEDLCRSLVRDQCGFTPVVKMIERKYVVCREYVPGDPADEALFLTDGDCMNDGEPYRKWIHIEGQE